MRALKYLSVLFIIVSIGIFASPFAGKSVAKESIRIGLITPMTGRAALEGSFMAEGAQLAVDEINAAGGVLGRPLQVIVEDGRADPTESVSAAQKLIYRDGVVGLIGAWASSATMAVMPVINEAKIPLVVEISTHPDITGARGNEYTFRISSTEIVNSSFAVPILYDKLKFTKVAFLAVNNDWGRGAADNYEIAFKGKGATITTKEFYSGDEVDFKVALTKIKKSGANSVVVTGGIPATANILPQMKEVNLGIPVFLTGGQNYNSLAKLIPGDQLQDKYLLAYTVPVALEGSSHSKFLQEYVAKYKAKYGKGLPERGHGHSYDAVFTIAKAIENAGSTDSEAVRKAIKKLDFIGVTGNIKFDKHNQSKPMIFVTQIKGKKQIVINK